MGATFGLWTLWCVLMAGVGEPFSRPLIRAFVRVAVVVIPAILYLSTSSNDGSDRFCLIHHWKLGIAVGCGIAAIHLAALSLTRTLNLNLLPASVAIWCNYIIFSPLAEELLFRRVAVDYFCDRYANAKGIFASAILFSLIHLPWWVMSGEYAGLQLAGMLSTLAVYGLVFGALYRATGSLWASTIPHWTNNLAATVFV